MQAGTYFQKVRRMLLCFSPLISTHFWPASTLLRGHLPLATLSLPQTDPQILDRWGYADEVHLDKCNRARDFGLECQRDVQRLSWILHIGSGFRMFEQFRKIDEDFGGSISGNTQPTKSCIRWTAPNRSVIWPATGVTADNGLHRSIMQLILLQHSHCTFVAILCVAC